jgi:CDP-glycerol glycerophosphotransferase
LKNRIEYILKHNVLIQKSYKFLLSFLFRFIGFFIKTDKNLILFNSFGGRKFNDSPKVIFDYILTLPISSKLRLVWAFENPKDFDIPKAETVNINSWKYFYTALKAKYWVSSVNIERGLQFKKPKTIYLNTWHGAGTKKIGNAVTNRTDFDFSNVNFMLTQSNFEMSIYKRDFKVNEESFLFCGIPRSDELFSTKKNQIDAYRKSLQIPKDKKIILYAPTWRESLNKGLSYDINIPINIKKWEEQLSDDYVVLFRTHAFTTKIIDLKFNDVFRDVSFYDNVNHLLLISDILITDYSTIVFDYSILEKPFLCFGYDYEAYKNDRGFYFDLENEYPNGVQKNENEILKIIEFMDYELESQKVKKFKTKYIEAGGNATEIATKHLLGL